MIIGFLCKFMLIWNLCEILAHLHMQTSYTSTFIKSSGLMLNERKKREKEYPVKIV